MGLLDFGSSDDKSFPLELKSELHPFRLAKTDKHGVDLDVLVRNRSTRAVLSSVVIQLPSGLGFDSSGLNTEKDIRLGEFAPADVKTFSFPVYANARAMDGEYKIRVRAIVHYRGYQLVEREYAQTLVLRVV